jgi:4-amino-4-deoxy-L-arabinose transferase-like glycosyltransferase
VSVRELARLAPLLAVYLAALAFFPAHPDDEAGYRELAERITHGTYVTGDDDALLDADPASPDLWFGPGLPLVLTPLAALDAPIEVFRLSGPVVLFGAMLLLYALARDRWGPRVALASTYAIGLYPPFWPLLSNVHSEPLAVLCIAAAMLGLARQLTKPTAWSFALASGALAGLALTRVAYGWVLTAMLIGGAAWWALRRGRVASRVVAITAAALALCLPWLAYTYSKTDRPFAWGNSGALSLYWMASPYPGDAGDWRQANDVFSDPRLAPHRPFFASLRGLPLAEQNERIERRAVHDIADHPLAYAENVGANLSRMLLNRPYSDSAWKVNDLLYAVSGVGLVVAAVFAAVVLLPRRGSLPPETGPFACLAIVAFVTHLLVAAYPRMLAPIVPLIGWLATLAAVRAGLARRLDQQPARTT